MEALEVLGGYPTKPLNPRARMVRVLLSMTVCMGCLLMLHSFLKISKSRKPQDFYSFEVKDARGRSVSLERYRGKVSPHQQDSTSRLTLSTAKASLVVNVASHSEHTAMNYRSLQELHRELGTSHFNVLAFPCGQFGETEMGASRDIEAYAKNTYGVTFTIFSKVKIMGSEAEPAFKFITDSVKKVPKWNFWKFLVNPEGQVVRFWKAEEPVDSVRQEAITMVRQIILKKRTEL
ncbi:probable glutathione peroxidase 8 isoform X1 [Oncorhynchus nerka]|uniref:probable glutathione peroxidase 8 isoform X1 n=1 Tax=Oncorhynchus nerka TaxID=8023 RepID=UPI001132321A|nr:probable glutathione peroxidase 8 isoform X1 [Oncorhynchus nerka]